MAAKKRSKTVSKTNEVELSARVNALENELAAMRESQNAIAHQLFYRSTSQQVVLAARWIPPTDDGWLLARSQGSPVSVPSHVAVSLTKTEGARDYFTVLEGALKQAECDVRTGYLVGTDSRVPAVRVLCEPSTPVTIDGERFDRKLTVYYRTAANQPERTEGPFPARIHPDNAPALGMHPIEIPDFPHASPASYGPFRTVWFRVGRSGDKYLHVGRFSAGCITCAPSADNWQRIYQRLAPARLDDLTVGTLEMR